MNQQPMGRNGGGEWQKQIRIFNADKIFEIMEAMFNDIESLSR